jgi:spermidine/putrescine transport system permease protein
MMRSRGATFWGLSLPPVLWLVIFFAVPLVCIFAFSLRADMRGDLLQPFTPTLDQYDKLLHKGNYFQLLWKSALMAFAVAAMAVALAFPVAYFLAFRAGNRAGLFLVLILIPSWTSFLLRIMAWKVMLGSNGVINSFLDYAGVIERPLSFLLYNRIAVIITLTYVWTPFVALPILAALQRIEPAWHEAAADLGANAVHRFLDITFPLSLPGVLAGFFMCFIPTVGEYVTPLLVGGSKGSMYGNLVQDFFTKAANWPFGAALSMVMLAATLIFIVVALRLIDPQKVVT